MRRLGTIAVLLAVGCEPAPEGAGGAGAARSPIVGGAVELGDPEVFMLFQRYDNGHESGCTGTLIGRRSIITAAHCVDPRIGNGTSMEIWVTNQTYANQATSTELIRATELRMHPSWDPSVGLEHDVAMLLLESAPVAVTPKPWSSDRLDELGGRPLRAVGYGANEPPNSGGGVKRSADLTFRQLTTTHIIIGDQSKTGICRGDSGGPSFHTFPNGAERLVGVHSFTLNQQCTDGADVRLDYPSYAAFVKAWLEEKEVPTCEEDRRCVLGCVPVDQDCACAADGLCGAECLDLSKDPDCPKDCVADGVCSLQECPTPDVDCVPEGEPCGAPLRCASRVCVGDAQHAAPYCSRPCEVSSDCPGGMECPFGAEACRYVQLPTVEPGAPCTEGESLCAEGAICTGPEAGSTFCRRPCVTHAECPEDAACVSGHDGRLHCAEPPPEEPGSAKAESPRVGCAAAQNGLGVALLLMVAALGKPRGRLGARER